VKRGLDRLGRDDPRQRHDRREGDCRGGSVVTRNVPATPSWRATGAPVRHLISNGAERHHEHERTHPPAGPGDGASRARRGVGIGAQGGPRNRAVHRRADGRGLRAASSPSSPRRRTVSGSAAAPSRCVSPHRRRRAPRRYGTDGSNTFIATTEAISQAGGGRFRRRRRQTYTLDPEALRVYSRRSVSARANAPSREPPHERR